MTDERDVVLGIVAEFVGSLTTDDVLATNGRPGGVTPWVIQDAAAAGTRVSAALDRLAERGDIERRGDVGWMDDPDRKRAPLGFTSTDQGRDRARG